MHFDCLFSFIEAQPAKFECSSVFLWYRIFLIRIKEMRFKNIQIRVDEAGVRDK